MRILGIDPGTAIVGYGLIDYRGGVSKAEEYGCIATDKKFPPSQRLKQIYEHLSQLLNTTKPDIVAVEKLYFNTNITTGIAVSQARGVILLAIEQQDIPGIWQIPDSIFAHSTAFQFARQHIPCQ